jgi:hypothetical protein
VNVIPPKIPANTNNKHNEPPANNKSQENKRIMKSLNPRKYLNEERRDWGVRWEGIQTRGFAGTMGWRLKKMKIGRRLVKNWRSALPRVSFWCGSLWNM